MRLPVMPPVAPMLAKPVPDVPAPDSVGGGLLYEPKWDGFRCIVFRDGDDVVLGSRNERPLTRYFPEVVEAVRRSLPERSVVDGEIVVRTGERLDFGALQQRIHPADSRVRRLAVETPASFVAFDLLSLDDDNLMPRPFRERRTALESALASSEPPIHLTRVSRDLDEARRWFAVFEGAGLDGLVCKPLDASYQPDKRVMLKVKHARTADCVVAGWRAHKQRGSAGQEIVGSLMLGLYDETGTLQSVGVAASFPMSRRASLVDELAPYAAGPDDDHPWSAWRDAAAHEQSRLPGAVSRWSAGKTLDWNPLRPELVVEVAYDAMEGTRFRHTTQFKRWRPDRSPRSCTYDQLEQPVRYDLADVLET
ncbi:MAG TPA: ATP-dependent DNA ligase [Candidatus Angelobacter sp.]|nr:ATP-dependent DNA ligase [Candidatus Angelobacter sp.]